MMNNKEEEVRCSIVMGDADGAVAGSARGVGDGRRTPHTPQGGADSLSLLEQPPMTIPLTQIQLHIIYSPTILSPASIQLMSHTINQYITITLF